MSDQLVIRRYEPSDADRVWEVHERALRASPLEFVEDAPADDDITAIAAEYIDNEGDFLVGLLDGEIVAMGGYDPEDEETAEVLRMRVHPEYQGEGYGGRLLLEIEDRIQSNGFTHAVLYTNEKLRAARGLYEKHGYEETARETIEATGDEFVHYRKRLTADSN